MATARNLLTAAARHLQSCSHDGHCDDDQVCEEGWCKLHPRHHPDSDEISTDVWIVLGILTRLIAYSD